MSAIRLGLEMAMIATAFAFTRRAVLTVAAAAGFANRIAAAQSDPLPSWNDGAAKQTIVERLRYSLRATPHGTLSLLKPN